MHTIETTLIDKTCADVVRDIVKPMINDPILRNSKRCYNILVKHFVEIMTEGSANSIQYEDANGNDIVDVGPFDVRDIWLHDDQIVGIRDWEGQRFQLALSVLECTQQHLSKWGLQEATRYCTLCHRHLSPDGFARKRFYGEAIDDVDAENCSAL